MPSDEFYTGFVAEHYDLLVLEDEQPGDRVFIVSASRNEARGAE